MIVDYSELENKSFSCVNGCAMCCLCQPELTDKEQEFFQEHDYLRKGMTREYLSGKKNSRPIAIKLQGKWGACYFLKNKRCTINSVKPRFCRQFPIHIHVMRRVQLNVNLSCRGVTNAKGTMKAQAENMLSGIPKDALSKELDRTKKIYEEFNRRCRQAGVLQSHERIERVKKGILPIIEREEGIGRLMAFTSKEPMLGEVQENEIIQNIENTQPAEDLDELAQESNYDTFDLEDIAKLPVYTDEELKWNLFQSREECINWMQLEEDGTIDLKRSFRIEELKLLPRDENAIRLFADYAKLLTKRESFMGNVAHICDLHQYRHDLLTVYLGVLGTQLLDLWWRTSLLGKRYERDEIDAWLANEGIRAFDMDCLDAPTLGSFI